MIRGKMNKITLIYAYYENPAMLARHFEEWSTYNNKEQFEIIIVDDCSKEFPIDNQIIDVGINTRYFKITSDIPWNQHGARNLAMKHAEGMCFLADMDTLLTKEEAEILLSADLKSNLAYQVLIRNSAKTKITLHPNTFILHSDLFHKVGGYDERYAGYYGTDINFRKRLFRKVGQPKLSPILTQGFGGVIKDSTTKDYGRQGSEYDIRKNLFRLIQLFIAPKAIKPLNFEWCEIDINY